jgi:hypothetical protein
MLDTVAAQINAISLYIRFINAFFPGPFHAAPGWWTMVPLYGCLILQFNVNDWKGVPGLNRS